MPRVKKTQSKYKQKDLSLFANEWDNPECIIMYHLHDWEPGVDNPSIYRPTPFTVAFANTCKNKRELFKFVLDWLNKKVMYDGLD